ncbi:hypothetical protein GLYMA_06G043466v4 [Glycine max]|nr:hypothetical protein GLYMA_06G043466v4 [Glycine max]KAH1124133.1 hypothetical protein GYH30_014054 [Glycine max]
MKRTSLMLFTFHVQHTLMVILLLLMILLCFSPWHVEGSRPLPHQHSPAYLPFIMAQAYSGPSQRGMGHKLIS